MTFEVGDKVIYPNHGLGIVERIEDKTILGTTCGFYHLRIVANDTTVLVPVSNVDGVGLRRAISDEEVERLFGLLGDGKIDNHQNWKGRFKDNSDKMRSGSIYEVADVLKSLTFLAKSKSLSFREKRMLDRAKFLIISGSLRGDARNRGGHRGPRRQRARALLHDQGAHRAHATAKVVKAAPRAGADRGAAARRPRVVAAFRRSTRSQRSPLDRQVQRAFRLSSPTRDPRCRPLRRDLRRRLRLRALRRADRHAAGDDLPLEGHPLHLRPRRRAPRPRPLPASRSTSPAPPTSPLDRAAVYCANHQSNVDPPILFDKLHPRMHIVYKAEINAIPLLARAFRHGGFVPIERRNKEAAMRSLEAGARSIQAGNSFLIFPEGTRSQTASLLPFKKGGFLMALKAQAPIVPGRDPGRARRHAPRQQDHPAGHVSIRVGEPIETPGMSMADRDPLIARVRERIEMLLAEGPVVD